MLREELSQEFPCSLRKVDPPMSMGYCKCHKLNLCSSNIILIFSQISCNRKTLSSYALFMPLVSCLLKANNRKRGEKTAFQKGILNFVDKFISWVADSCGYLEIILNAIFFFSFLDQTNTKALQSSYLQTWHQYASKSEIMFNTWQAGSLLFGSHSWRKGNGKSTCDFWLCNISLS